MKIVHLSDLHIGKRVNEFSMLEEQQYILAQIISYMDQELPDGVIIAGDIYDKPVPAAEAVLLFDQFLTELSSRNIFVMIISGNHDSVERISFGSNLMCKSEVYIAPAFSGEIAPIVKSDQEGEVRFYLLPFVKPAHVRRYFPDEEIITYQDAVGTIVKRLKIDKTKRNIMVAHQFITGAVQSDSEELSVGGLDNIDAAVFDDFDYVALGHIHRPQRIGRETVRYCGSPLKYSFSEANYPKTMIVLELKEKGNQQIKKLPLVPRNDLRIIKGSYDEVIAKDYYHNSNQYDYLNIILTDEEDIPEALGKLRVIYPNVMKLEYDNQRTREERKIEGAYEAEKKPLEYIEKFYQMQNNQNMNEKQIEYLAEKIEQIWEVDS